MQLVGWPTLRKPDGSHTGTSSQFRVPVSMGRFKEKRDILYEHYNLHSAQLAQETEFYSERHQQMVALERYDMEDYKSLVSELGKKHTASNYPCGHCCTHKVDLKLRPYDRDDVKRMKHSKTNSMLRHINKEGESEFVCALLIDSCWQAALMILRTAHVHAS